MRSAASPAMFLLLACSGLLSPSLAGAEADIFRSFTAHIQQQVESDKKTFVDAQVCTEWFYKQLRPKPAQPKADLIARALDSARPWASDTAECRSRYPGGIEAARKDFSRTQSSLSVSLTFYEYALVGDRNDDAEYNEMELRDMLESFGLPFNEILPPAAHLGALNAQFDVIHRTSGLDVLMTGMGVLYERGYRFTPHDRDALHRISG